MIKDTSGQDQLVVKNKRFGKPILAAITMAVTVAASAALMSGYSNAEFSVQQDELKIAKVERGDFVRDIATTGRIVAANAPRIYATEQGVIKLLVKAGDKVTMGEPVATVDSPELQNALQQQNSELQRLHGELERKKLEARRQTLSLNKTLDLAQVELNAALRENRRAQLSIEKRLISQIDLEKAVDDLARAKLNFKHAQKEVALAKDTLAFELKSAQSTVSRQQLVVDELQRKVSNLDIEASVSGIVGNMLVEPQALVAKNQAVMTLVDLSAFEAELQVSESYANELGLGMQVLLKIGSQEVMGELSAISPEVNEREVTTRVRFSQQGLSGIRQNQRISARILLENKSDVLMVKRGAFMQEGGSVAYLISDGQAQRIDIATGAVSISEVEVLGGLKENDQIVISSYTPFKRAERVMLR
ncbi:HlyD family efflux transporter periplasmic adaptor subunit [Pseudoalteromonas sp. MMG022]|uniref:efflux RND transporter periplasmic adaptor subunit n=1 Tax=Pseudoalteromonas sp. MMG022 TaxID=2909978 RepID=UPI001F442120|nr:HlyD family efflux transporter periplasmic adaptor subunit [Pseudoalteromonas sp. MMG022]MCF6436691.1 efflux RND transporter periplasmic adaptor subunit [Pseudoalteromonas sp. MMG022]